jgi:2-polyprenyl-3-methyl-5-hydroxy-6-metoxy-1,4-benzoquinol methylase
MGNQVFEFGKNWEFFIKHYFNQEKLDEAKKSFIEFVGEHTLRGKTFIDVGCGSGLFSLAAYKLGASKVMSFDVDQYSVKCCKYLREQEGNPQNWEVFEGSALDRNFLNRLGKHDLVYSWGVLHHTGDMWQAIENVATLVKNNGLLYIALYNKADGFGIYPDGRLGPSSFWVKEKKFYSALPALFQNLIDYCVMCSLIAIYILTLNNPIKKIQSHKKLRGMSWRVDIKDWLGGYPYEYASVAEIFTFLKKRGFALENLKCNNGLLNNEYLFSRERQQS